MNRYLKLTDRELTDRLNNRDDFAYAEIYRRYWKIMHEIARKLVQDNDAAKDIVQDSFISLYTNIGKTDFTLIDIAPYLHRIVRNNFINLTVRDKRNTAYLSSLRDFVNAGEFVTDQQVRENEVRKLIESEIARLPKKMRAVFEMSRKQYMTRKEIADATNLSEETVKKQIANALKHLKSKLGMFLCFQIMVAILWINR